MAANERSRFGDWEADTIVGYNHKSGLLTLVDRKSRFLRAAPLSRLGSKEVKTAMIEALRGQPLHSITPDRGREFQLHGKVTTALGVKFYFPPPHQPWQRGTNENTNGLLREYFPKGYDFSKLSDEDLQKVVDQLNHRPRKCLGYRTPAEVYFSTMLHLDCTFACPKTRGRWAMKPSVFQTRAGARPCAPRLSSDCRCHVLKFFDDYVLIREDANVRRD